MWSLYAAVLAFAASLVNAAVVGKRDTGVTLTNHVLIYYNKDLCTSWIDHCDRFKQRSRDEFRSTCKPIRTDANTTTIVKANCFIVHQGELHSVSQNVATFNGWTDPDYGFVIPHAALIAANATRSDATSRDEREEAEYQGYYDLIQQQRSESTIEKLQSIYDEYKRWFKKAEQDEHVGRYYAVNSLDKDGDFDYYNEDNPFKEVRLRSSELVSFKEFQKFSEMKRQNVINHASGVAKQRTPYPDTALKHIQHLKYRDEAFKLHGYENIKNSIEDIDQFVEKKRRGRLLKYPA